MNFNITLIKNTFLNFFKLNQTIIADEENIIEDKDTKYNKCIFTSENDYVKRCVSTPIKINKLKS
uniref:Uncharacterized protein n=1 Tax=viral metagenome TaxID=1070528 RepID=A0A6C0J979_9ZZZZ